MSCSNEATADFGEHLQNLRQTLSKGNEAAQQLQQNIKFIKEKETVWNHVNVVDPSLTAYIPLHFSNHRELIRLVELILEFCKYLDEHKAAKDQQNTSRMQILLQKAEMAFRNNWQMLHELQSTVTELQNQYKKIQLAMNTKLPLMNEEYNAHTL